MKRWEQRTHEESNIFWIPRFLSFPFCDVIHERLLSTSLSPSFSWSFFFSLILWHSFFHGKEVSHWLAFGKLTAELNTSPLSAFLFTAPFHSHSLALSLSLLPCLLPVWKVTVTFATHFPPHSNHFLSLKMMMIIIMMFTTSSYSSKGKMRRWWRRVIHSFLPTSTHHHLRAQNIKFAHIFSPDSFLSLFSFCLLSLFSFFLLVEGKISFYQSGVKGENNHGLIE